MSRLATRSVCVDMVMPHTADEKRDTGTGIRDNVQVYTVTLDEQSRAGRNSKHTRTREELGKQKEGSERGEAKWIKGHRKGAEPLGETGQEGEERNREEPS